MNYYRMGPPAVFAIAAAAGLALFLTLKDAHNGQQEWEIGDASSAIAQAARIVGIPEHVAVSAELVVVEDDVTPFLHDQILGKRLWKVIAQDWNLDLPSASASGAEGSVVRTFEILVNPVNGSILKIRSRWPEGIAQIAPEPPADVAAEQMTRSGWESYDGFPKDEPSVSFLQALDVVPSEFRRSTRCDADYRRLRQSNLHGIWTDARVGHYPPRNNQDQSRFWRDPVRTGGYKIGVPNQAYC